MKGFLRYAKAPVGMTKPALVRNANEFANGPPTGERCCFSEIRGVMCPRVYAERHAGKSGANPAQSRYCNGVIPKARHLIRRRRPYRSSEEGAGLLQAMIQNPLSTRRGGFYLPLFLTRNISFGEATRFWRRFMKVFVLVLAVTAILFGAVIGCGSDSDSSDDDDDASDDADDDLNDDVDDDADDDTASPDDDDLEVDPLQFAVEIIDVQYGDAAGYGRDYLPDNVLGPPAGGGDTSPQSGEDELLSLGIGGQITLRVGYEIIDGEGPDLAIFENPFFTAGQPDNIYTEAAVVEVSADGEVWHRFPCDFNIDGEGPVVYANPDNFTGLAGINPVFANPAEGIDPFDALVAGGDYFDLADVGLESASFVRIIDTGDINRAPGTETYDDNDDLIDDAGNHFPEGGGKGSFDLDAVAVLNFGDAT